MPNHIPKDFIDQLLNRIDIVDLIDQRVTLKKKSSNNYFACCPFHNEKNPSFSVSQNKQFFYCFGCSAHGNAVDFLMQYDRLNFPEAIEALASQLGLEVPKDNQHPSPQKNNTQPLYELMEKVVQFYQTELKNPSATAAIEYLKGRGLNGEIAKSFEIGYAPAGWNALNQAIPNQTTALTNLGMLIKKDDGSSYDRFRERIMFPIRDRRGRLIGFGGRIVAQGEPKYLNSPETPLFQKGHELYGLHQLLQSRSKISKILVVEGYMDVIALHQAGINYSVATLGTATTEHHLRRLLRYAQECIFCFDGDSAGAKAAWRALEVTLPFMQDGVQVRFMFLPQGDDPDSLIRREGKSAFENLIDAALPIGDFFFQTLIEQTDISSTDGKARLIKSAKELLVLVPEGAFKQLMLEELARKTRTQHILPAETIRSAQTASPRLKKASPISPLKMALILLLQHPELAHSITEPLPALQINGYDLFKEVFAQCQDAQLTTGRLLEIWRGKPQEATLAKLSMHEHLILENNLTAEFTYLIGKLHQQVVENQIETLLSKAAMTGLTMEEKQALSRLIQKKNPQTQTT